MVFQFILECLYKVKKLRLGLCAGHWSFLPNLDEPCLCELLIASGAHFFLASSYKSKLIKQDLLHFIFQTGKLNNQ